MVFGETPKYVAVGCVVPACPDCALNVILHLVSGPIAGTTHPAATTQEARPNAGWHQRASILNAEPSFRFPLKMKTLLVICTAISLSFVQAIAQTSPEQKIRQELSEPFCYFAAPTDQLGFKGCPKATVVTYDGAFISAFGQLSFYAGAPDNVRPINKRVKTLVDGYIPVIQFAFDRDGLHYAFEAFATPVDLNPRNNLITFIQCKVSNPGGDTQRGVLGANFGDIASAINVDPGYGWFKEQRAGLKGALGGQRSTVWHSKPFLDQKLFDSTRSTFGFSNGLASQGEHLVFVGPATDAKPAMPDYTSRLKEASVEYGFSLEPGTQRVFRFKMPAVPTSLLRAPAIKDIVNASYDDYRAKTVAFWKAEVARADRFSVQDPKVMNTFRTSLVNDLVATEVGEGGEVYQRVNKIHYDYMWIRDSSFFVRTYDMLGLHDLARNVLQDFIVLKNGKAVSFFKPGAPEAPGARMSVQEDYWGQVLWAFGEHCRTTGDRATLDQIYPLLAGHIDEFVAKCGKDPRGLWPVAGPYDNEMIDGHYTGHSFWALLGLKYAVMMANDMSRPDDARKWQKVHDEYEANFLRQLRELTSKSEGYIPPGMDSVTAGNDWDNASGGIYPFEVLAKDDPLAQSTLKMVRDYNYQEGIITYGGNAWVAKNDKLQGKTGDRGYLHHYETFYVTESNTVLGEQKKVVEDLYSILAHTGSTNSGFEFSIPAWSTRDPQDNFTPHGWFAARFMSQVRDSLVREEGNQLHLASVLAPEWVEAGREVTVKDAPTFFGAVNYRLRCSAGGASLTLGHRWLKAPSEIVFHTPWFVRVTSAKVDGRAVEVGDGKLVIPPLAKRVDLKWNWIEHPNLSFKEAVRLFLEKYYRKSPGTDYSFLFPKS